MRKATLISKIVNTFRKTHQIDGEKELCLMFDGDRLSPQGKVADTELSDMDYVDVYIR